MLSRCNVVRGRGSVVAFTRVSRARFSSIRTLAAASSSSLLPDSYYARSAVQAPKTAIVPQRGEELAVDVAIVGGGMAGLSTAYELAAHGVKAAVVEANQVGWGASGRNGGFVFAGYALGSHDLTRAVGKDKARDLYQLSIDGVDRVRARISRHNMASVAPTPGILEVVRYWNEAEAEETQRFLRDEMGHPQQLLLRSELEKLLATRDYYWGLLDTHGFHMHPLNYVRGLTSACSSMGVTVLENARVSSFHAGTKASEDKTLTLEGGGRVKAQHLIFTCGGYIPRSLVPTVAGATIPVATYVVGTTPMKESLIREAIRTDAAILDTRRCGDYYRVVWDDQQRGGDGERLGRFVWGGRISAVSLEPRRLGEMLLGDILRVFPQLVGKVQIETAWSGLMSYGTHKMVQLGQLQPGVWYASGFGGHGLNTTAVAGRVLADAIAKQDEKFKLFAPFGLEWAGGRFMGPLATQAMYWLYQAQDWLQERRSKTSFRGGRI